MQPGDCCFHLVIYYSLFVPSVKLSVCRNLTKLLITNYFVCNTLSDHQWRENVSLFNFFCKQKMQLTDGYQPKKHASN